MHTASRAHHSAPVAMSAEPAVIVIGTVFNKFVDIDFLAVHRAFHNPENAGLVLVPESSHRHLVAFDYDFIAGLDVVKFGSRCIRDSQYIGDIFLNYIRFAEVAELQLAFHFDKFEVLRILLTPRPRALSGFVPAVCIYCCSGKDNNQYHNPVDLL